MKISGKHLSVAIEINGFYVFRRLVERNDDVSINDRLLLSSEIVTREDFVELIFPDSFNRVGLGRIRIVSFGTIGC